MLDEPQFTRGTILAACDLLAEHPAMQTHAKFDGLILELGAEEQVPTGTRKGLSLAEKANALKRYLIKNPSAYTPDGDFIVDTVVRKAARLPYSHQEQCLTRALARDGFAVTEDGTLRRMMPEVADLPRAQDEVHSLLEELNMATAVGHLDQALDNHASGNWAAANSQLRSFTEDMFDELAVRLEPDRAASTPTGHPRRQLLAALEPPFLVEELGEWSSGNEQGKNFVNGMFKRLHGHGSHPGLSDEDDCTFRLHLVLVMARYFLRRARELLLDT